MPPGAQVSFYEAKNQTIMINGHAADVSDPSREAYNGAYGVHPPIHLLIIDDESNQLMFEAMVLSVRLLAE